MMGYILPVPQYQYIQYRERVTNDTGRRYSQVSPIEKADFKEALDQQRYAASITPEKQTSPRRLPKKKQHELFHKHLAKFSGKGERLDQRT
ncbi:hypothetical protein QY97_03463 [Bacillus thermotolerans]|nr:hypothetical protein QY97_03463 [Bacillus thermotolerans]